MFSEPISGPVLHRLSKSFFNPALRELDQGDMCVQVESVGCKLALRRAPAQTIPLWSI